MGRGDARTRKGKIFKGSHGKTRLRKGKKTAAAGRPFFIQLSWNALHAPENALKATLAKYERLGGAGDRRRASVAAITEDLDTGVGWVLEAIDRLGLAGTTYVVYLPDNGSGGGRRGDSRRQGLGLGGWHPRAGYRELAGRSTRWAVPQCAGCGL